MNSGWLAGQNTFPMPPGSLQDGVTYYWHVYTSDQKPRPAGMTDEQYAQHLWNNPQFTTNPNWVWSIKVDLRLGVEQTSPMDSFGPGAVNLATGNFTTSLKSKSMPTVGGDVGLTMTFNSKSPSNTGLIGTYYPDVNQNRVFDEAQVLSRVDPRPYFDWGLDRPSLAVDVDNFMVRWTGFITMPTSGSWSLGTISDDGVRIFLDNAPDSSPFLSSWQDQGAGPLLSSGTSTFEAGVPRPIRMEYYEHGGYASAELWAIRRNADQSVAEQYPVPGSWLSPGPMSMPQGWSMSADLDGDLGYSSLRETTTAVILYGMGGETHEYRRTASGYTPPPGEDGVLSLDPNHYTLQDSDGRIYLFARNGGHLLSATSTLDDRKPAAPVFTWSGSTPRLSRMTDPVSGRSIELFYGGESQCPGANNAPAAMLCRINYWDGTVSDLSYASGFLVRMANPGTLVTDLGWNAGRLESIREPYSYDLEAAGMVSSLQGTVTHISYDAQMRVTGMAGPTPGVASGSSLLAPKQHNYDYYDHFSDVREAGLSMPTGYARRVTYDDALRQLKDVDATAKATEQAWNVKDQVISSTDAAGLRSTTFYDHADRPIESYGPAPASYYGGDNRPNGTGSVPYGTTRYDESMTGLQAAYWAVGAISGPPKMHGAEAGATAGVYDLNWGAGAPAGLGVIDNWGMRLTGEITMPVAGNYQMQMVSDSAVRLWVDDILVSDAWGDPGGNERVASLGNVNNATAGSRHRIRIDFVDVTNNAHMYLMWLPPGGSWATVPNNMLSPRYGLATGSTSPEGKITKTNFQYPYLGLPTQVIQDQGGLNLTTSTGYEAPGVGFLRRTSRTLPAGNAWSYAYYGNTESRANPCVSGSPAVSQAGFLKITTAPDPDGSGPGTPRSTEQVHDNSGRVVASRVDAEPWSCVTYDARDRVTSRTVPAFGGSPARTITNTYSVGGNPAVSSVSDATGTITTGLDWVGRPISYTDVWNKTTTSTYDQPGRLIATSGPRGSETFTYDPAGRLIGQSLDGLAMASAGYDNSGRLTSVNYPSGTGNGANNTTGAFAYNPYGRTNATTWAQPNGWSTTDALHYDFASGRVIDQVIDGVDDLVNSFTYDGVGRLINAKVAGHDLTYQYASSGGCGTLTTAGANTNRTAVIDNGVTKTQCYDNADRLMSNPSDPTVGTVVYDAHGNTTQIGRTVLAYDGSDRHLQSSVGDQVVTYKRDATDRIVERSVVEAEVVTRRGLGSSSTTGALALSSLSVALPVSTNIGDVVVATISVGQGSNTTITTPAGWTLRQSDVNDTNIRTSIYTKTWASGDPITANFVFNGSRYAVGGMAAYAGVDTTSPVEMLSTNVQTASTALSASQVTTPGPSRRLLSIFATQGTGTIASGPTQGSNLWTRDTVQISSTSTRIHQGVWEELWSDWGPSGTRSATSAASANAISHLLALKPKVKTTTIRYGHSAGGDSADLTLDAANTVIERTIGLVGGVLVTKRTTGDVYSYPNIHGDIVATADGTGARIGTTMSYDPYGQALTALADNQEGTMDYAWLGKHQRPLEHQTGLNTIEMGARQYVPPREVPRGRPRRGGKCKRLRLRRRGSDQPVRSERTDLLELRRQEGEKGRGSSQ